MAALSGKMKSGLAKSLVRGRIAAAVPEDYDANRRAFAVFGARVRGKTGRASGSCPSKLPFFSPSFRADTNATPVSSPKKNDLAMNDARFSAGLASEQANAIRGNFLSIAFVVRF
ncbi:MAG TPA: hypothetical protein PLS67_00425 [Accumulibacter sp.]|nr:hypothetical protein [Accumulibacter sp.]HQC78967.1 hypothetical protein [Accumulibacter sp.]